MEHKNFTEANRKAWNKASEYHRRGKKGRFFEAFKTPGYSSLDRLITRKIKTIGLTGKAVAQICCNDGREVLSLISLGAKSAVGFDISDAAIAEARELAAAAQLDCEFVRTDVYEIPESYNNRFDFIYISIGVLGWMPDLPKFFAAVARLLRSGGDLLVYEQHPFVEVFQPENLDRPLTIINHYFNPDPIADESGFDYWGGVAYRSETNYWFVHPLSEVITAMINNDLTICGFEEYPHDISSGWGHIEKTGIRLPLSFTLQAKRA